MPDREKGNSLLKETEKKGPIAITRLPSRRTEKGENELLEKITKGEAYPVR